MAGRVAYYGNIVKNGLILDMDAAKRGSYPGTGTAWNDISGFQYNGILTNGPTFDPANGGSIVFDGSNDFVSTNYNVALTDFTVCMWFKAPDSTNLTSARLIDKNYITGMWLGKNASTGASNSWGGGIRESNAPYGIYLTLTDGQWHFLVSIRSGTTHTLYGDGISNTTSNIVSATALSTDIMTIGSTFTSGNYFKGTIPQILIYNRALSLEEILQNYNATRGRYIPSPSFDSDAQAFITVAAITDVTQQNAINTLVLGLKADSIWNKIKAIYPFVGGTNTSTSYNLKNISLFQITWNGGFTWDSNGVTGNGTTGYGNTGIIPSSALTNNSLQVSIYSRTNNSAGSTEIGCSTSVFLPIIGLSARNTIDQIIFDGYDYTTHRLVPANTDSRGFFMGSITSSTSQKVYKNGVLQATQTTAQTQTQPSTYPLYLFARNDSGTAANYSIRNLAFASVGDGLSDTEATNFYTRVQAFQTALGRQV
jgi:hypothetical protein